MNRKLVILALSLIFVGIIGALFTWDNYVSYDRITTDESIHAKNIEKITVLNNIADVEIRCYHDEYIHVLYKGKLFDSETATFDTSIKDNELRIDLKGRNIFRFVNFQFAFSNLEIYIPKDEIRHLTLDQNIGDIKMKDLHIKNIDVSTSVSEVYVEDVLYYTMHIAFSHGVFVIEDSDVVIN